MKFNMQQYVRRYALRRSLLGINTDSRTTILPPNLAPVPIPHNLSPTPTKTFAHVMTHVL